MHSALRTPNFALDPVFSIPELRSLDTRRHLVRIPHETDVPLTDRVRQLLDTPEFRRLARISQLGLVSLVYPAANHSRLEHSLGVYRNALLYLKQLSGDERFTAAIQPRDAEAFIVAALLHDLGHWPFCHALEDMALPGVPSHELFANSFLLEGELADTLRDDWNLAPRDVTALFVAKTDSPRLRLVRSILSGPIDVDKMDYLDRDSLHCGVPYGRNFDRNRLMQSLLVNDAGDGLAISAKGRTAAELMVFARYVMFSEVYWHHAVRAATAMLQRAFYLLQGQLDLDQLFRLTEQPLVDQLVAAAGQSPAAELLDGLFGPARRLYKRLAELSHFQQREFYEQFARRPYPWLAAASEAFAASASKYLARRVAPHQVLLDAPPVRREVEFDIEVFFPKENVYRRLADISPAVVALATRQFDDYVKRVRVFVHPSLAAELRAVPLDVLLDETLRAMA
jgi:HD superfamily phosphohydrolase